MYLIHLTTIKMKLNAEKSAYIWRDNVKTVASFF
jgi:hypothetical protein